MRLLGWSTPTLSVTRIGRRLYHHHRHSQILLLSKINQKQRSINAKTTYHQPYTTTMLTTTTSNTSSTKFTLALIQMLVSDNKSMNIKKAENYLYEAFSKGCKAAILPEMWNTPYDTSKFREYGENIPNVEKAVDGNDDSFIVGESVRMLMKVGKETGMVIVGGSVSEIEKNGSGKIWNTCVVIENGRIVGKHRKIHLFDVDVPNGIKFKESDVLNAGDCLNVVDLKSLGCKMGIMICYDVRFIEMGLIFAKEGCDLIVVPGAFNMTTGPLHWELLGRSRAVDTQCWVAMCSPARDENAKYVAWGHSMVVDPWGKIVGQLEDKEGVLYVDVDSNVGATVRQAIPTLKQRRHDIYGLERRQYEKATGET